MHRRLFTVSPLARSFQIGVLVLMLCAVVGLLAHSMLVDQKRQIAGHTWLEPALP